MRLARSFWSIGLVLALAMNAPLDAAAKGGGSSGSHSSSSISRAPSISKPSIGTYSNGGISKPPITAPPTSSISKPSTPSSPMVASPPRTAADTAIAKGQSQQAYRQFQADQQRFRAPSAPSDSRTAQQSPVWRSYGGRWHSVDAYYAARTDALNRSSPTVRMYYEHPPAYVLAGRPSYGGYAAAFLGGMLLDRITQPSYAEWAYSHYNDVGFQAWYADMQRQAADNAELRAKLAQLDQQVNALKEHNAPVTEALPDDVDPSLIVAPQTVMLATSKSTNWWMYGAIILGSIVTFFAICLFISVRKSR